MKNIGIKPTVIRAGQANMFLSPIFRDTLAGITGATIELYNTDGSQGAARGAGIGTGIYKSFGDAFKGLKKLDTVYAEKSKNQQYTEAFEKWEKLLNANL